MKTQVELTEKEIIEKLIAHYEYAIKEVEKAEWFRFKSDELYVDLGMCWCAENILGFEIHKCLFIGNSERKYNKYIYPKPLDAPDKNTHLERIQYRIDFLKNALKEAQ